MVGQSVWTPGVKTVWYIPGVKTVWYVHACFICSCFHSPLLTSERSKLVLQLKAENLPLSSWWLWHQQLNIYCSKNNVSVDKRGGPAAGSRCDLSFILPHLAGKTRGFNNIRGHFFFIFFIFLHHETLSRRETRERSSVMCLVDRRAGAKGEARCEKQTCTPTCLLLIKMQPSSWDQLERESRVRGA